MFDQTAAPELLREDMPQHFRVGRQSMARNGDIAAAARNRLQASAYRGVRSIVCDYHEGVLVLRGRVSSYHQKQLAQEAIRRVAGILEIVNAVQVVVPNGS
jgi:osmotically-inducible protein OsmY